MGIAAARTEASARSGFGWIEVERERDGRSRTLRATAVLIAPDRAVVPAHAVKALGPARAVRVRFPGCGVDARVATVDREADVAILELETAVNGATIARLAAGTAPDLVAVELVGWASPGELHRSEGVLVGRGRDRFEAPVLSVVAPEAAAALLEPDSALTGSAVLLSGEVIGFLRSTVPHPESLERSFAGLVHTAPAAELRRLLGLDDPQRTAAPVSGTTHLFISYRKEDEDPVSELKNRLEAVGLVVYAASHEMAPDTAMTRAERRELDGSRAALLVVGPSWSGGSDHVEDTSDILARAAADPGYVVRTASLAGPATATVLEAYRALPSVHLWDDGGSLRDAGVAALITGILGAADGSEVWRALEQAYAAFERDLKAARKDPVRIERLMDRWREAGLPYGEVARDAAHYLSSAGRPERAVEILEGVPGPASARALALALARAGRNHESVALLEELRDDGQLDAKTATHLGSRYKQMWYESGRRRRGLLRRAFDVYLEGFRRDPESPWAGINAATVALLLERPRTSRALATRVLTALESVTWRDAWWKATQGEAALLLGHFRAAIDWYEQAAADFQGQPGSLATMRRQAELILECLGETGVPTGMSEMLAAALYAPGVAAFAGHRVDPPEDAVPAGRFPPDRERSVRRRIREWLDAEDIGLGVCSGADGGDLIFAEEVLARGGRLELVLPYPLAEFAATSVRPEWRARLERVAHSYGDRVEVAVLRSAPPEPEALEEAFAECTGAIVDRAIERGHAFGLEPHLAVVWDGREGMSETARAVRLWRDEGRADRMLVVRPLRDDSGDPDGRPGSSIADVDAAARENRREADRPEDGTDGTDGTGSPHGRERGFGGKAAAPEPRPETGRRLCLAIGINQYDVWPDLENAVHDAEGFALALREHFGFTVTELRGADATKQGITRAIADGLKREAREDDMIVIFFAGHGQTLGQNGFLVPVEADLRSEADLIPIAEMERWASELASDRVLYVFDSCFSGLVTTGSGFSARGDTRDARIAIAAGQGDQTVADGGANRHSVFTARLIEGLTDVLPGPERGPVSVFRLFDYVYDEVTRDTRNRQLPALGFLPGHGGGRIAFTPLDRASPSPSTEAAPPTPAIPEE